MIIRSALALVLIVASQNAMAGSTLRDHRGSSGPTYVKPMQLPEIGRHGGFSAIAAANKGKGKGPIVRDHRH